MSRSQDPGHLDASYADRRDAALRLPPLPDGRRDPDDERPPRASAPRCGGPCMTDPEALADLVRTRRVCPCAEAAS